MPILDSNLLIRLDVDDPVAVKALGRIAREPLIVPYQAALEYSLGTEAPDAAIDALDAAFMLERPEAITLVTAAERAAAARKGGARVLGGDAWIAASAALRDDYVVTTNKRDFTRLGVAAWNYEKEDHPPR